MGGHERGASTRWGLGTRFANLNSERLAGHRFPLPSLIVAQHDKDALIRRLFADAGLLAAHPAEEGVFLDGANLLALLDGQLQFRDHFRLAEGARPFRLPSDLPKA